MTSDELRAALKELGWTQAELSRRLNIHVNAVSRWATGKLPVPGYAAEYLRMAGNVKKALDGENTGD